MFLKLSIVLIMCSFCYLAELPTLYEHYTSGGIKSGLKAEGNYFTLNGKEITIFSGSFHYFRVHNQKWRNVLLKFKAAGLNAVQFYSPWNLHEEIPGHFDFESGLLNLTDFLHAIKEADMFALYRPGPYICGEWELGGLPAWLLRDPNMKFRSNYKPYLDAVDKYYSKLLNVVNKFQFTSNGGPIIAMQIENEFGWYGNAANNANDAAYLKALVNMIRKNGFDELLFTSDGLPDIVRGSGTLPEILKTVNFGTNIDYLKGLKKFEPDKPSYVAEFWAGWYDNWGGKHNNNKMSVETFAKVYEEIIFQLNSSVNMYMFIGGTNFGFMNGEGITTSYDYDAPLNESGNYTAKYWKAKELIEKFTNERNLTKLRIPAAPKPDLAAHYGVVKTSGYLSYNDLLTHIKSYKSEKHIHPELLNIGPNYGQNFGFTLYRTTIPKSNNLKFVTGHIKDRAALIIDEKQIKTLSNKNTQISEDLSSDVFTNSGNEHILDLLVENMGRIKGGQGINSDRKGISDDILVDDKVHNNWEIFPLDFKPDFVNKLKTEKWRSIEAYKSPALYRATLEIKDEPKDTYLRLDDWHTSVVFVNSFNLGRYWNVGPAKTMYVPAPFLKKGENEIYLFETYGPGNHIEFVNKPNLG